MFMVISSKRFWHKRDTSSQDCKLSPDSSHLKRDSSHLKRKVIWFNDPRPDRYGEYEKVRFNIQGILVVSVGIGTLFTGGFLFSWGPLCGVMGMKGRLLFAPHLKCSLGRYSLGRFSLCVGIEWVCRCYDSVPCCTFVSPMLSLKCGC